jgi:hypothetical protein
VGKTGWARGATKPAPTEFRGRVYDSIIETIGATPLVRIHRLAEDAGTKADMLGKCEFFNPLASVKDRIGVSMIAAAEAASRIKPNTVLVEPTSGWRARPPGSRVSSSGSRPVRHSPPHSKSVRGRTWLVRQSLSC